MADIAASGNFTPAELLAEVNKAIQAVLVGGQSYKIGSRSLTRADLNLLLTTRNDLTAQIAAEEDNGLFSDTYVCLLYTSDAADEL